MYTLPQDRTYKSGNGRSIFMRLLRILCKEIDIHFHLLKEALGNWTRKMSSSYYTSVPDLLALLDFSPPPTSTSCKKGLEWFCQYDHVCISDFHYTCMLLRLLPSATSSLHNSLVVEKVKEACSQEVPWRKTVPFLVCRIFFVFINHNRNQHALLPNSLHWEQCRLGCYPTLSGCDVTNRDHLILFHRGIGGFLGRGGQGDSRVQESKEKRWVKCIV